MMNGWPWLVRINADLAKSWIVVELSPAGEEASSDPFRQALESFQVLAASVMQAGAPDMLRLQQLRYTLLKAIPDLDDIRAGEAAQLLRLATAVDGLHENKHLAFAETLLWVVMELLLAENTLVVTEPAAESDAVAESNLAVESDSIPEIEAETGEEPEPETETGAEAVETTQYTVAVSELTAELAELLPQLSNTFARSFSETDPRINAIMAAAFDIVQKSADWLAQC